MSINSTLFSGPAKRMLMVAFAVAVLAMATFAARSDPSGAQVGNAANVNQYASKFLCGVIFSPASASSVLAPGVYNTAVNIHNPNNFDIYIQKKAVVSLPESGNPDQGLPGQRETHVLQPDASMEVDCNEIFHLLTTASPPCAVVLPGGGFCKGYVVVEAARIIQTPTGPKIQPAQADITDILSVKEEDGIWKDYTFHLSCPSGACGPILNYRYDTPYNIPHRPPVPPCYGVQALSCTVYDVDQIIRARVDQDCGFCGAVYQPGVLLFLNDVDFDTDSRSVDLDFEFVTAKRVQYPQWPVNPPCDLSISKVGQPGVPTSGTITYTITVSCSPGGGGSGGNVHVHDSWPPIVIFSGPTPSQGTCGPATANPFECDLGVIPAGGSATITFSVDTGNNVTVQDTATVDPHNTIPEPNESNNSVTVSHFVP